MSEANEALDRLLSLTRRHTRGEASPRRHQATRALVLDHLEPKKRSPLVYGLAGMLLLGGGAGTFAALKHHYAPLAVPGETKILEAAEPEDAPAVDMPAETVPELGVKIQVWPENAAIYWDDKKVGGNPSSVRAAADGKTHRVRAEAPGHAAQTRLVVMDSPSALIELTLRPLPVTLGPITSSASIINVDVAIDGLRETFERCYVAALAADPSLPAARATLVLRVGESGRVESATLEDKDGLGAATSKCVADAATETSFPSTGRGVVRLPLAFRK